MKWLKSLRQISICAVKLSWTIVLCTRKLALFLLAVTPPLACLEAGIKIFCYEFANGRFALLPAILPLICIAIIYYFIYFTIKNLPAWDFTYWRRVTMGELALNISIVLASLGIVAGVML